jgi:radical SAM protein with 4Fe4S-binding SPASM domain
MKFTNKFKDFIVFSHKPKRLAYWLLTNSFLTNFFLYRLFHQLKMKKAMDQHRSIPGRLRIENTNICNADCIFCPHQKMKRKQGIMDFELFKKIIEEARLYDIPLISIHGFGEPLLDKDFFTRVKYAREKGVKKIATNTNASFLNDSNIDKLLESGLDEIYISFDAATEDTYKKIRPGLDFQQVESNIKKLVQAKKEKKLEFPKIFLSFVECRENRKEVKQYLRKWKGSVDGISISYLINWAGHFPSGNLKKDRQKKDPCRFLWTDMAISWDGKVTICCYDYENDFVIGDLTKEKIKDVWNSEELNKLRKLHLEHQFREIKICKECIANFHSKNPWWLVK